MTLLILVIVAALVFTFINGFHDTANSIATVVATKVLSPRQAVMLAAVTNLVGAFFGTAVAKTISAGIIDSKFASSELLFCALLAAIVWNLLTWWLGLPSSSSHALIGALCGAGLAAAQNNWHALIWSVPDKDHWWKNGGILWKVIVPMITSPVLGLILGFIIMAVLYFLLRNWRPVKVNKTFGILQLFSSGYMGFAHGMNDAQKTMGVIFLGLIAGTGLGAFDSFNPALNFLYSPDPIGTVPMALVERGRLAADRGDLKAAAGYYQNAADAKSMTGKYLLAQALKSGAGVAADPTRADKLMAELVDAKFDPSLIKPATPVARKFKDAPATAEESAKWLQQKVDAGNADAMVALGAVYLNGTGVTKDEAQAKSLFERATARNHPAAWYDLGVLYSQGLGVQKDPAQAEKCFRACVKKSEIPVWIIIVCGLTMCAGTAVGGWRIIKTLGHKMVKIHPVHGFAAETTAASILFVAAKYGMPVSTTHAITTSIMGVGAAKSFNAIKLVVVERILWAWALTLPVTAAIAYAFVQIAHAVGWM